MSQESKYEVSVSEALNAPLARLVNLINLFSVYTLRYLAADITGTPLETSCHITLGGNIQGPPVGKRCQYVEENINCCEEEIEPNFCLKSDKNKINWKTFRNITQTCWQVRRVNCLTRI